MLIVLNRKNIRQIVFFTLLLMFCAHAFCYANLSFSGASVMVDVSSGNGELIENGQFLASLYWRVRGALSSPMTVGLLSAAYLTASAILMADLLGLTHALSLFSLCGVLTLHVSVTAINAAILHMADLYFLALLFAVLGAWLCLRHPLGFIPAAACFAASLGLQQSLFAAGPALALIACMLHALRGKPIRAQLLHLLKSFLALAVGFALYYAAARLFAARWGVWLNANWRTPADGPISVWLSPFRALLTDATAYTRVCKSIYMLLIAACWGLGLSKLHAHARAFAAVSALLFPLIIAMPVFTGAQAGAVCEQYAFCMLPVALIALLDLLCSLQNENMQRLLRMAVAGAFGVTFLSSIVFANQVYLKKNLEYQTTLSAMTRVIEQAEQTNGFEPGLTPVAIIGTLEESAVAMPHKGFEHLAALDAAANNFAASSQEENLWYFWEIMGYPFNFVSDGQRDALAADPRVQQMPAFPQKGFCQMVGSTLVIRLSPAK